MISNNSQMSYRALKHSPISTSIEHLQRHLSKHFFEDVPLSHVAQRPKLELFHESTNRNRVDTSDVI